MDSHVYTLHGFLYIYYEVYTSRYWMSPFWFFPIPSEVYQWIKDGIWLVQKTDRYSSLGYIRYKFPKPQHVTMTTLPLR